VVLFGHLLTDGESDQIIEWALYKSVTDTVQNRSDGTAVPYHDPGRTSTNGWYMDACPRDPTVEQTTARMVEVTGIAVANYDFLQILRYTQEASS
jgi:hypothetical protein